MRSDEAMPSSYHRRTLTTRRRGLPDERQEAVTNLLPVLGVSVELPDEDALLADDAKREQERQRGRHPEPDRRADEERRAHEHENGAQVHRVAHDGVDARRYDALSPFGLDAHQRRQERVVAKRAKEEQRREQETGAARPLQ